MENELLPIGSIVQLEDSTAAVMIAGYLPLTPSKPDRIWNYSGFRFPLGFTDDESLYCFDHDQIQVVYAYGYRDIEHDLFMKRLSKSIHDYGEEHVDSKPESSKEEE